MKSILIILVVPIFIISCDIERKNRAVIYSHRVNKFDSIVNKLITDKNISGTSIGVAINDSIIYSKGFGFSDTSNTKKIQPNSIFAIASVTKLITAIGILKLQEEGKLSIDHSIVHYFPELPDEFSKIKIKNLLNHTSGLALMTEYADSLNQSDGIDIRNEKIFSYMTIDKIKDNPNEYWAYNNTPGYLLLSLLIERASHMDYGEFIEEYIAKPLRLKQFGLCSSEHFKHQYKINFNIDSPLARQLDTNKIFEQLKGQGGICSSSNDLLKIIMALHNNELISKENYSLMYSKTTLNNGMDVYYGLGSRLGYSANHFKMGHTGGAITDFSVVLQYPDDNVSIVVLTNSEPSNATVIAESLAEVIFDLKAPEMVAIDDTEYQGIFKWGSSMIEYTVDSSGTLWESIDYGGGEIDSLDYYYIGDNRFYNKKYRSEIRFYVKNNKALGLNSFSSGLFSDSDLAKRIDK